MSNTERVSPLINHLSIMLSIMFISMSSLNMFNNILISREFLCINLFVVIYVPRLAIPISLTVCNILASILINIFSFIYSFPLNSSESIASQTNNFICVMSFLSNHLYIYSCPYNISFSWNIGFLLFSSYSLQLVTGILLALHYT
jgi:hypothetical protein